MIAFSNQILLVFSLYHLCCIILTTEKQIIAFKEGTFAPPALPTERQEGHLLPPAPSPVCLAAIINQLQNDHFKRMVRNECFPREQTTVVSILKFEAIYLTKI